MNTTVSTLSLANNHLSITIDEDESDTPDDPNIRKLQRVKADGLDIELYSNNNRHEFIIHDAAKTILHEFPTTNISDKICLMWTDSNTELREINLTSNISVKVNKKGIIEKLEIA